MTWYSLASIEARKHSALILISFAVLVAGSITAGYYFSPWIGGWRTYKMGQIEFEYPRDWLVEQGINEVKIYSPWDALTRHFSGNASGSVGFELIIVDKQNDSLDFSLDQWIRTNFATSLSFIRNYDLSLTSLSIEGVSLENASSAYLLHKIGNGESYIYFFKTGNQLIGARVYRQEDLSNPVFQHIYESVRFVPPPPPPPLPPLYPPPSKDYFQGATTGTIASIIGLADPDTVAKLHDKYLVSPNGKYKIVVASEDEGGGEAQYIADMQGNKITSVHTDLGSFVGWTPDSKNAMFEGISYLSIYDKVSNPGIGGFGASVSPVDGSIVYSDECCGTNDSELRIRDTQGNDKVLIERGKYILAWETWSPKGNKIAFLKGDPSLTQNSIWIINPDGTGLQRIGDVDWDYPPVWSDDGSKIIFTSGGFIWAYDVSSGASTTLSRVTGACASTPIGITTSTWSTYKRPDWEIRLQHPSGWQVKSSGFSASTTVISGGGYTIDISRDTGFGYRQDGSVYDSCDQMISGQPVHVLMDRGSTSTISQLLYVASRTHTYEFIVRGPSLSPDILDAILSTIDIVGADIPKDWTTYKNPALNIAIPHPSSWSVTASGADIFPIDFSGSGCDIRMTKNYPDAGRQPTFTIPYGNDTYSFWVNGDSSCNDITSAILYHIPPAPPPVRCNVRQWNVATSTWSTYSLSVQFSTAQWDGKIQFQYPPDWQVEQYDGGYSSYLDFSADNYHLAVKQDGASEVPDSGLYGSCNFTIGDVTTTIWENNIPSSNASTSLQEIFSIPSGDHTYWFTLDASSSSREIVDTFLNSIEFVK